MATKMIGLDLGQREVRAWLLEVSFSRRETVGCFTAPVVPLPEEDQLDAQLRTTYDLLSREGLLHEAYAITLPRHLTSVLRFKLPVTNPKLFEEILPGEIEENLPFDIEDLFFDYQVLQVEAGESEILVVYALIDEFEDFMNRCSGFGLDPKVLTLGGLYLHAMISEELQTEALQVALDIGESGSEWVIYQGQKLVHIQRADVGGAAVTQALAECFKVDEESAETGKLSEARWLSQEELEQLPSGQQRKLAETINQMIENGLTPLLADLARSFAFCELERGGSIKRLELFGSGSLLKGLDQLLSERLNLPVSFYPISEEVITNTQRIERAASEYHLAFAMAQGLAKRLYTKSINLRRGDYSYAGDAGGLKQLLIAVVLTIFAVAGIRGGELYLKQQHAKAELAQLQLEVDALGQRLLGRTGLEIDQIKDEVTATQEFKVLIPETSALDTLGELSRSIQASTEVELDSISINLQPETRGSLELQGKTKTVGDVSAVITAVEETSCFRERVKKDKVSKSVDERTAFRVTASATCK